MFSLNKVFEAKRFTLQTTDHKMETSQSNKKLRAEATSTPNMAYRERQEIIVELTPIKRSPLFDLNGTLDSVNASSDMSLGHKSEKAGMSPELRQLLITPRKQTELDELKSVLTETLNLTRAAMRKGIISRRNSAPEQDLEEQLEDNCLFRPIGGRSSSLSDLLRGLDLDAWELEDVYVTFGLQRRCERKNTSVLVVEANESLQMASSGNDNMVAMINLGGNAEEENNCDNLSNEGMNEANCQTLDASPILRKRQFSPTEGSQLGSLRKHSTTIKEDDTLRRKLNQTFFTASPGNAWTLQKKENKAVEMEVSKRVKKTVKRKLNDVTKQTLITSVFSPKNEVTRKFRTHDKGLIFTGSNREEEK